MTNLISGKDSRIYYNVKDVFINSSLMTNITDVKFTTFFYLTQCFCSCGGVRIPSNLDYEYHNEDCPGAEGKRKIGYVDDNWNEIYF